MTLHIKIRYSWCGSGNWFFSNMFSQFAEAGEIRSKALNLLEKSVINMI
jgi:hypothetical protein